MEKPLAPAAYQSLAELLYQIRRFLYFSEQAARDAGLEPQQHQLMLALKGLPKGARLRIEWLATAVKQDEGDRNNRCQKLAETFPQSKQMLPAMAIILRHLRQPARLSATLVWPNPPSSAWCWSRSLLPPLGLLPAALPFCSTSLLACSQILFSIIASLPN